MADVLRVEKRYHDKLPTFWNRLYVYSTEQWNSRMSSVRSIEEAKPTWLSTSHPVFARLLYDKVNADSTHITILLEIPGLYDGGMKNTLAPIGMINAYTWSESEIKVVIEYYDYLQKDIEAWWSQFEVQALSDISTETPSSMSSGQKVKSLQKQLVDARENLRLIEERKTLYVLEVDIPLQLVKEERRLKEQVAELEKRLIFTMT